MPAIAKFASCFYPRGISKSEANRNKRILNDNPVQSSNIDLSIKWTLFDQFLDALEELYRYG